VALPEGRREVSPSREAMGDRRKPGFGTKTGISVPISFGLPLIVVGLFLLITAATRGGAFFWLLGGVMLAGGLALFASGKRL
jgi:fucose permease